MNDNGKNGSKLLIGGSIGGTVLISLVTLGWNTVRSEIADARVEIRELRAELKEIQKLAAERGQVIPDHERRLQQLERRGK